MCAAPLHLWNPNEIIALHLCVDFDPYWLIPILWVFAFRHLRWIPGCAALSWKVSEFSPSCYPPPRFLTTPYAFSSLQVMVIFCQHTYFYWYHLFQICCWKNIFQKHKLSSLKLIGIELPAILIVLLPDNWKSKKVTITWQKIHTRLLHLHV